MSFPFPMEMFGRQPARDEHFTLRELHEQEPVGLADVVSVSMHRVEWIMLNGWLDSLDDHIPAVAVHLKTATYHAAVCNGVEHPEPELDTSEPIMVDSEQENGAYR